MKNDKRELISQDDNLLNEIVQDLRKFNPCLTVLKDSFEGLQMGSFTNEVFRDLVDNGISNIADQYKTGLEKELTAAGVKNPILRKVALSESEPPIIKLEADLSTVQNYTPPNGTVFQRQSLTLEFISFIDGSFQVSKEDRERILETYCRVYLENEAEKTFFAELDTLKNALSVYLTKVNSLSTGIFHSNIGGLEPFFSIQGNNVEIKPSGIKWALSIAAKREKEEASRIAAYEKRNQIKLESDRKFFAGELPGQVAHLAAIQATA